MSTERPARRGELCTCGRPAVAVFVSDEHGEVGWCGTPNVAPVSPCPFCGAAVPHWASWGDPAKCPEYRVDPEMSGES